MVNGDGDLSGDWPWALVHPSHCKEKQSYRLDFISNPLVDKVYAIRNDRKMTVARFTAEKISNSDLELLLQAIVDDFSGAQGLVAILLFGSAVHGSMTTASDLDVVLVFGTKESCLQGRKLVPYLRKKAVWPMDLICVDEETFKAKSEIGGIYFVAKREGRVLFGVMP